MRRCCLPFAAGLWSNTRSAAPRSYCPLSRFVSHPVRLPWYLYRLPHLRTSATPSPSNYPPPSTRRRPTRLLPASLSASVLLPSRADTKITKIVPANVARSRPGTQLHTTTYTRIVPRCLSTCIIYLAHYCQSRRMMGRVYIIVSASIVPRSASCLCLCSKFVGSLRCSAAHSCNVLFIAGAEVSCLSVPCGR